jgi:hypothetical protein
MTSDRMIRAAMREPHDSDVPISEQFRRQARTWARLDGDARRLEAMRDPELAKRSKAVATAHREPKEMSLAASEREVRATQEWHDFLGEIWDARQAANEAWTEIEYLRMRHDEEHPRERRGP